MATYLKANNTNNLNLTTSWTGSIVPTSSDIGQWDSTVAAANATVLGADMTWAGISILNPGGTVTINSGNNLQIGSSYVSLASATQDLAMACTMAMGSDQTWNVTSGRSFTLSGVLSGSSRSLTKTNSGGLTLSNSANTYSGKTICSGGFLYAPTMANGGSNSSIGSSSNDASNLVFSGGNIYHVSGSDQTTDRLFTITTSGLNFYAEGGGAVYFSNTGSLAFSGSGSRGAYFNGTGSLTTIALLLTDPPGGTLTVGGGEGGFRQYTALNTYTGTFNVGYLVRVTNIADGGVASNIGQSSNSASSLIFAYSGAEIQYYGATTSTNRLFSISSDIYMTYQKITSSGSGPMTWSNTGSITYNGDPGIAILPWRFGGTNTDANYFFPVLSDYTATTRIMAVSKVDAGTWYLSGTNTYTGDTTVSAGKLFVNGSIASGSRVYVSAGATLGGGGTVAGPITMQSGGSTLAPGSDATVIGDLRTGNVTFVSDSTFSVTLNGITEDSIISTGTVTCAGQLVFPSISNHTAGAVYTIISASTVSGTFANYADHATFINTGYTYQVLYSTTSVQVWNISNKCVNIISNIS